MTDEIKTSQTVDSEVNDLLQKKDFGAVLKRAREKSTLSLAEVADNLLISIDIIKALENSQADALPALTFTQGYIRSYARMLGVSADEIIEDYVKMAPNSKQVLTPNSVLPVQKSSSDTFVKFISLSLIVIGVIVLAIWLVNTDFKIQHNTTHGVSEINKKISEHSLERSTRNNLMGHQSKDTIEPKKIKPEKIKPEDELPVEFKSKQIQKALVNDQPEVFIKRELVATKDNLFLSALGDSWCEIQDSTGKRLFYQLLNRGEEVELSGAAPFTVFLGNAPKVRVEVNNKIVDFENLINKNSNIASLQINRDATVISISN